MGDLPTDGHFHGGKTIIYEYPHFQTKPYPAWWCFSQVKWPPLKVWPWLHHRSRTTSETMWMGNKWVDPWPWILPCSGWLLSNPVVRNMVLRPPSWWRPEIDSCRIALSALVKHNCIQTKWFPPWGSSIPFQRSEKKDWPRYVCGLPPILPWNNQASNEFFCWWPIEILKLRSSTIHWASLHPRTLCWTTIFPWRFGRPSGALCRARGGRPRAGSTRSTCPLKVSENGSTRQTWPWNQPNFIEFLSAPIPAVPFSAFGSWNISWGSDPHLLQRDYHSFMVGIARNKRAEPPRNQALSSGGRNGTDAAEAVCDFPPKMITY